jgi:hypothetical protein
MSATIAAARIAVAAVRLTSNPPWDIGLSNRSLSVAPSGRVRIKAAQNRKTRDTFVK